MDGGHVVAIVALVALVALVAIASRCKYRGKVKGPGVAIEMESKE